MISFIYGGSSSGKSAFAENRIVELAGESAKKYYLATMIAYGREGEARVAKHRSLRAGKGFVTIEQPRDIEDAISKMDATDKAVLLECMSNLVANEMFKDEGQADREKVALKIDRGIRELIKGTGHLVIVSNNVFEDGIEYDEATTEYLHALGEVNIRIASMADEIYEVVAGIPVKVR